jgi:dipeptidyl aminopeptidase/acylaminoacyl peptidase
MKFHLLLVLLSVCLLAGAHAIAADSDKDKTDTDKKTDARKELKIEDLFPEKSIFGPSAQSTAFSHDGKYGAYLYKTCKERRHGNDLYIYDVEKGEARRVTWPSVMAQFQKSARRVVEDRKEKAKKDTSGKDADKEKDASDTDQADKKDSDKDKDKDKDGKDPCQESGKDSNQKTDCQKDGDCEKKDDKQQDKEKSDEDKLRDRGDWVSDKDADDEKAPRYSGIGSLKWSPIACEMLIESEGDIFRYELSDDKLTRLTSTRDTEGAFDWLPDGGGYTYRRDKSLMKVVFGSDIARQLDPKFPNDDTMERYELSPDGRWIAFLTTKETKAATTSTVEIASYKDRMMESKEQPRHVSDDPLPVREKRIYLYRLSNAGDEKDTLTEVFKGETHMPDDMVKEPVWSPDSTKIAFMTFEQDPALVKIYEATIPRDKPEDKKADKTDVKGDADTDKEKKNDDKKQDDEKKDDAKKDVEKKDGDKKDDESNADNAKEIFRFLHYGGPNTPGMMKLYYLADNKRLIYMSEQTGFRHIHLLDPVYESFKPLTSGQFEVYPIDISKDRKWLFAYATKEHPSQTDVYKIATNNGRMIRLTQEVGTHSDAAVSDDGTKVLTNLVSYEKLKELVFIDAADKTSKTLTDSHPEKAHKFAEPKPEFFDYKNRLGQKLYGMMFKPDDWSKDDKRPVLIYFYGGPLGTQKQVVNGSFSSYSYAFPYYMAKKHGYVTCTIDTRGNSGYAGVFEKANFGQVGKPQVEDLVDGVKYLVAKCGADKDRVAIHGWSFGGFQTQMCMYTEPDVFKVGIAGAGPTEWENYNSWYTRHTIGASEPGKATLKEFSLLPLAKNLKGHLLLVHGMEDSNVLYQDTVKVYRELLKAGKETLVELFLDPTGGHGLGGDVKTLSRYRKYEEYLVRTNGVYEAKKGVPEVKQGKGELETNDKKKDDKTDKEE